MYGSGKPRGRAGAAGAPALAVERGQRAVGGDAGADVRGRRRTVAGVEMLFLAIEHQLHRRASPCFASFAQMIPCASGANLLPKPPPMYCVMVWTLACGMPSALREALRALNHRLRRDPRGQLVAVPLAHGAVRLEADVA